jgi:hypothetical protein
VIPGIAVVERAGDGVELRIRPQGHFL